jgi:hypothetical protein
MSSPIESFTPWSTSLAQSVAGAIAGGAIAPPILDFLGLVPTVPFEKYFKQLNEKLDHLSVRVDLIRDQLNHVSTKLDSGISEILTEVRNSIAKHQVDQFVYKFEASANRIDEYYNQMVVNVAALSDQETIEEGARGLFKLLGNEAILNSISIAMRDIRTASVGDGRIISLQPIMCKDALDRWAAQDDNIPFDIARNIRDSSVILKNAYPQVNAYIKRVMHPTFRAILAAQIKGLQLLTAAGEHPVNKARLKDHIANILMLTGEMKKCYAGITPAFVDGIAAETLKARGKYLSRDPALFAKEDRRAGGGAISQHLVNLLINGEWMEWGTVKDKKGHEEYAQIVMRPWEYRNPPRSFLSWYGYPHPNQFIVESNPRFKTDKIGDPPPFYRPSEMHNLPVSMTLFFWSLPSKTDDLAPRHDAYPRVKIYLKTNGMYVGLKPAPLPMFVLSPPTHSVLHLYPNPSPETELVWVDLGEGKFSLWNNAGDRCLSLNLTGLCFAKIDKPTEAQTHHYSDDRGRISIAATGKREFMVRLEDQTFFANPGGNVASFDMILRE